MHDGEETEPPMTSSVIFAKLNSDDVISFFAKEEFLETKIDYVGIHVGLRLQHVRVSVTSSLLYVCSAAPVITSLCM
jgi:hypothetical protein